MNADLTDEDRAAIERILLRPSTDTERQLFAAGLAVGRARALEEAAKVADSYEPICDRCPQGCAAAIRVLK